MTVSPFVQRNLSLAQYAQARGSQYEGPFASHEDDLPREYHDRSLAEIRESYERLAAEVSAPSPHQLAHEDHYVIFGIALRDCTLCPR